ncbi:hypothetical protein NCLIV_057270 [Neospora caninum Liverpool]|uniref:Uncharacterized protein n=1 Tax=Neospora caninum (strain Liverpool) TaxID=572307 RepID=F0VNK8_NEOCL|nr:hypothetical protein NCLIV_057270 [Neospora caninum Liverpool]CBZ55304.1 hypothetical protein NCLIV_057270 [Neospora caninum Liverpool]|eukprot:XP_003885332.1 hypothetical protein NCLIV_057270 [Neospora caninum Liverpool]
MSFFCFASPPVCTLSPSRRLCRLCCVFQNEEELMETLSQSLLAAVDRDCVAGWGAVVHVMTPNKITTRQLKCRMD